jgi:5-methylcytosine-specific restriction endonuclease McrA
LKEYYINSVKFAKNGFRVIPCNEEYFYKNKSNKTDGLHPYCKKCTSRKYIKWVKENIERKRERDREWVKKPKNIPKVRRNQKLYKERGKRKEWERKNKDKLRMYAFYKTMHRTHEITDEEWEFCKQYFNYSCAYCGVSEEEAKKKYGQRLHKEHVYHEGANDLSNCVPACKRCNSKKWMFKFEEWYNENNPVFDGERLNRIKKWIKEDYKLFKQTK